MIKRGDWYQVYYSTRALMSGLDLATTYQHEIGLPADTVHFSSNSGGGSLARVLRGLPISAHDRVLDIGCGKGGALITLSDFPFGHVAGLEISDLLAGVARSNLKRIGRERVIVYCTDAAVFDGYDEYTYVYLFNPFPAMVMSTVMALIAESLVRQPRRMFVIYKNPVHHDLVSSDGLFDLHAVIECDREHPCHIYRSVSVESSFRNAAFVPHE